MVSRGGGGGSPKKRPQRGGGGIIQHMRPDARQEALKAKLLSLGLPMAKKPALIGRAPV